MRRLDAHEWQPRTPGAPPKYDYDRLLDGDAWELGPEELDGVKPRHAASAIRRGARNRGREVRCSYRGDTLIVQALPPEAA